MATVRMTTELKETLVSSARSLFSKRLKEAEVIPSELNGDAMLALKMAEPGCAEAMAFAAKDKWFAVSQSLYVKSLANHRIEHPFALSKPVGMPDHWNHSYRNELHIPSSPEADRLLAVFRQWKANTKAIEDERNAFVDTITKLVERHATLRQALAEWPGLWELVPAHVRERHNRQADRAKREREDEEDYTPIDTSALNTAIVTAKLIDSVI
jgi:hypothetical protein